MRVKHPVLLVVLPMHLVKVRAEVPHDRLVVVGPVAEGRDVLLDLHTRVKFLLEDIDLVCTREKESASEAADDPWEIVRPREEKAACAREQIISGAWGTRQCRTRARRMTG